MNEHKPIISSRIKSLRKEYGYTQEQLASILGLNAKSSIANYENGANSPSDEIKKKMSELFDCTIDYLIGLSDIRKPNSTSLPLHSQMQEQYYMCPVYSTATLTCNLADACIEGRIPVNSTLFNLVCPEEYFFLHITEESMNKLIKSGSYALIHRQDKVENGEIAVLLINQTESTLKRFTKKGDLTILEPLSNNDDFQLQIYDKTTSIQVLGKYVGKFELND